MNLIHDDQGHYQTLNQLLHGPQGKLCNQALSNKLGRLNQSNDSGVQSTNAIEFTHHKDAPQGQKFTCTNF